MAKINYTDKEALNIDTSVDDKYKCQSTDMNSIKNAINQNAEYVLMEYVSDDKFKCTIEGGVNSGDIIHIKLPTVSGITETGAQVSYDDGETYHTLRPMHSNMDGTGNFIKTTYTTPMDVYLTNDLSGYVLNYVFEDMIPIDEELLNISTTQPTDKVGVWIDTTKNLFDKNNAKILDATVSGTSSPSGSAMTQADKNRTLYIPCKPDTTYTVQKRNDGNTNRFVIAYTKELPAYNVLTYGNVGDNSANTLTITTGNDAKYLVVFFYRTDESTLTYQQVLDSIQIEYNIILSAYEPFRSLQIKYNNKDGYDKLTDTLNVSNDLDTNYRVNLLKTKNLCDEIFELGNINDSGVESTSTTTYRSSNYLSVKGDNTLICSYTATSGTKLNWCACYDKNKTFITRLTDLQTNPFTLPLDTAFIRIGFYKSSSIARTDFSNVMLEYGSTSTTYSPFIQSSINIDNEKYSDTINVGTEINNKNRINVLYSKNLFNKNDTNLILNNININSNTGKIQSVNNDHSILLPCKSNTTYTISKISTLKFNVGSCPSYPNVDTTLNNLQVSTTNTSATITTGSNDKYIVAWIHTQADTQTLQQILDSIQIEQGSEATPYEPYITPSINIDGEEIYSKTISEYTTSEQVIGRWIDSKPLYRKVVDFGTLPNATSKTISTGLTASTTRITKIDGVARDNSSGYCIAIPHINTNNLGGGIQVEFNTSGEIFIRTSANYSSLNGYMILEYTKTTD